MLLLNERKFPEFDTDELIDYTTKDRLDKCCWVFNGAGAKWSPQEDAS